ncbi:unnamed protein product [Caretta caretta]
MEPEGSWPVLNQANEVTLVLTLDPKEALPLEQLQHVLGPFSEKLFDDLQEEQPAMESAAEAEEAEIALKLAYAESTGDCQQLTYRSEDSAVSSSKYVNFSYAIFIAEVA